MNDNYYSYMFITFSYQIIFIVKEYIKRKLKKVLQPWIWNLSKNWLRVCV